MPVAIQLGSDYLYTDLSVDLAYSLMSDIISRYEGFFFFSEAVYPDGKAELLFHILKDGYGLAQCADSVGIDVIDLTTFDVPAIAAEEGAWREEAAGRLLAQVYSKTIQA